MNVLVIGSGGREHALCWKLRQSSGVNKLFCVPGNAGIARVAECVPIPAENFAAIAEFAKNNKVRFAVIGPEVPLCGGIVDFLRDHGIPAFGPGRAAACLEGSKTFAKEFMNRYAIPTARAAAFDREEKALAYLHTEFANGAKGIVIKADGLAAGKGVTVTDSPADAETAVRQCFSGIFGNAGARVVIEECLEGEELSVLALTDGKAILPLASSQDHKRLGNGDAGPNTGGMGAYSPAPVATPAMMKQVDHEVLQPFLRGIQAESLDYHGIIYAGIMVTADGPKVLEFNVRFGDPETQAVLARLESDLAETMLKTIEGRVCELNLQWSPDPSVCVVMASGGYPGRYRKGFPIRGIDEAEAGGAVVFHAGTELKNGDFVNTGGRVLGVTATGTNIRAAIANVYAAVGKIHWQDVIYREDIAHRAINRRNTGCPAPSQEVSP